MTLNLHCWKTINFISAKTKIQNNNKQTKPNDMKKVKSKQNDIGIKRV